MTGCINNNSSYQAESIVQEEEMNHMSDIINEQPQEGVIVPMSDIEREIRMNRALDWARAIGETDLSFLLDVPFAPAPDDIDLNTIEIFVFSNTRDGAIGEGFVLDKMHGNVYFVPDNFSGWLRTEFLPHPATFQPSDLTRLIQVIEESNLQSWEDNYIGCVGFDEDGDSGHTWTVAILFSDGTMLRSSGTGLVWNDDFFPPQNEWQILTDFIAEIGAEIQERHHAEQAEQDN